MAEIAQEIRDQALAQNLAIKNALQALTGFDFSLGHEFDRRLKANPELRAEFINDPVAVTKREIGIVLPNGVHCHYINENNEYFPKEGDAISQLLAGKSGTLWNRVEIRMAVGPGCYAFCFFCHAA